MKEYNTEFILEKMINPGIVEVCRKHFNISLVNVKNMKCCKKNYNTSY